MNDALQDWLKAEAEYFLQRDRYGHLPLKQIWGEDTIELRAYAIYQERINVPGAFAPLK